MTPTGTATAFDSGPAAAPAAPAPSGAGAACWGAGGGYYPAGWDAHAAYDGGWDQCADWQWGYGSGEWFGNGGWDAWPPSGVDGPGAGGASWWTYGGVTTPGERLAASVANETNRTAQVHFTKTYQVLSDIIEQHPKPFKDTRAFLDLGCAPGGFASRLLEDMPADGCGYGVTMPTDAGGFPVLANDERFHIQVADLMSLASPDALDCPVEVDVCTADAQDLGKRTNTDRNRSGRKGGKGKGKGAPETAPSLELVDGTGVGAADHLLGIWALTLQQFLLAFGRLRDGGVFVFRFGWRGRGTKEERWYSEAAHLLFGLLFAYFEEAVHFKSEFSHQAHAAFYVVASGFRGERYGEDGMGQQLREVVDNILACARHQDLPECMAALAPFATPEARDRTDKLLEAVGRLREIGVSSRHHKDGARRKDEASIMITPLPLWLSTEVLTQHLQRYGKVTYVRRKSHPIGVGADAVVKFTHVAHARVAMEAVNELKIFGDNIAARSLVG